MRLSALNLSVSSRALFAGRPTPAPVIPALPTFSFPAVQAKMAAGQRAQIAIVGDSAVAGWGSGVTTGTGVGWSPGNPGNYVRAKSWPAQLKDLLIAAGIPARHDAYFSSQPDTTIANVTGANPNIAPGAGWVLSSYSLSGTILQCPNTVTTATTFTPEIAADSFDIIHSANTGLGTLLVTDEDGLNVPINTGSTAGAQVISSGGLGLKRTTITRPVASTKPIQISRSAGGAPSTSRRSSRTIPPAPAWSCSTWAGRDRGPMAHRATATGTSGPTPRP